MHSLWEPLAATYHDWGKHSTHKLVIVVDGFLCFPHWLQGDVTKCKDMNPFIYNIYVIYIYTHNIIYILYVELYTVDIHYRSYGQFTSSDTLETTSVTQNGGTRRGQGILS